MILTGLEIRKQVDLKNIIIQPFNEENIQPNSYDFHLSDQLIVFTEGIMNDGRLYDTKKVNITSDGYLLNPGILYLGLTLETFKTNMFAQLLFGSLSVGSLGLWVHISAPLAHVGSSIRWTLEIRALKPVLIYPGMKFGKICFLVNHGEIDLYGASLFINSGKYLNNEISVSLLNNDTSI